MINVVAMIDKIRERPALIGRPSVRNLYTFLAGFAYGRKDTQPDIYHVLARFGEFVHDRFEVSSPQSWAHIIDFFSVSEQGSLELFWELWDEFCLQQEKVKKNGLARATLAGPRKRRA